MPDLLLRFLTLSWNGVPVATVGIFAIGGAMYLVMNSTSTPSATRSMRIRRPGWLARR